VIQSNVAKQTTTIPTLSDQNVLWILHSTAINPDTEAGAEYDKLSKCSDGTLWIQSTPKNLDVSPKDLAQIVKCLKEPTPYSLSI
jgi:hypothetical protein